MSQVVSTTLPDNTAERLKKLALSLGQTPGETSAMLIEESLREAEFTYIEFRNRSTGDRQAYMKGSNLAVWQVIMLAQNYDMNCEKVAQHLVRTLEWVQAAFNYAKTYPDEINEAIADFQAIDYTALQQILPQIELKTVPKEIFSKEQ